MGRGKKRQSQKSVKRVDLDDVVPEEGRDRKKRDSNSVTRENSIFSCR